MAETAPGADAGVQPPSAPSTPTDNGAQPSQDAPSTPDYFNAIERLEDDGEIGNILFGGIAPTPSTEPATPVVETAPAPEPAAPAAAETHTPAGDTPQDAPTEQATPAAQEPPKAPDRIRTTALSDDDRTLNVRAIAMVRDGQAATLADAILALSGKTAPAEPAATPAEPTQPAAQTEPPPAATPQTDADVTRVQSELATLRQQRTQAIEDYDKATEARLQSEIEDKLIELQEVRLEARARGQQQQTYASELNASIARVKATYPESDDPESAFAQAMVDELDLAAYRSDPILNDPRHVEKIAERVANRLGSAQTPGTATPPPPPVRQATPIGLGAPGRTTAARLSPAETARLIDEADPETLAAALGFTPA